MGKLVIEGHCFSGTAQFGKHLILDLEECELSAISSREVIAAYAMSIVAEIEMTAYGDPVLEHFGHNDPVTSGWTLVQLIETSSITGHFSEGKRSAHLDIFSCRPFDTAAAIRHSATVFGSSKAIVTVLNR